MRNGVDFLTPSRITQRDTTPAWEERIGPMWVAILAAAVALGPVERAVAYLSREVPQWRGENGCFSCHHNGDAARALYRAGVPADGGVLGETTAWVTQPAQWETNPGDPAVSDKKLARIQFATALLASGRREPVCAAATFVARDREADGSWKIDSGSPATYGTVLATYLAREVLRTCGTDTTTTDRWLAAQKPKAVVEAAALLLADPSRADARRWLVAARNRDGGFGEFPGLPSEVFDTAVAALALRRLEPAVADRARQWLRERQQPEGGWPETTRPPGSQSYAQHISTTAWALLALLDPSPRVTE